MIINVNNDEVNISTPKPKLEVEEVSPVRPVSPRQDLPANGNSLQSKAATPEQMAGLSDAASKEKIGEAVRDINEHMQVIHRELEFSVDEDSGKTVIKVMDLETKQVIRQIPNEEALNVARMLDEGLELKLFSGYT